MKKEIPRNAIGALAAVLFWAAIAFWWTMGFGAFTSFTAAALAPGDLPRSAPPLPYVDHEGVSRRTDDNAGRATLVSFMYLRCPGVCHLALAKMGGIPEALDPAIRARLNFLSLSIDGDRPEDLSAMRKALDAPPDWRFGVLDGVAGEDADGRLADFGVLINRRSDGLYNHTTSFFLLDDRNRLVRIVAPDRVDAAARTIEDAMR